MKLILNTNKALSQPDPYILKANGKYYIYATARDGVQLYESDDMYHWDYKGFCFEKADEYEYWAPAVTEINGKYFMYVSSMKRCDTDVHTQRIYVCESDCPQGPFEYKNELLPPFSIDAHVVNTSCGLYIFYCNNDYEAERAGTLILVDKMPNPYTVEGNPKVVVRPTLDEEIFERNRFKQGQHWHTIEGAFYFKEGDYHYIMYSGSTYQKETYFIGYSVAKGDTDDLRKLDFKKYPSDNEYKPLICKNEFLEGSGHNSVIKENGKYYIVYHARDWDASAPEGGRRTFRIDEMKVDNGVLSVKVTK